MVTGQPAAGLVLIPAKQAGPIGGTKAETNLTTVRTTRSAQTLIMDPISTDAVVLLQDIVFISACSLL